MDGIYIANILTHCKSCKWAGVAAFALNRSKVPVVSTRGIGGFPASGLLPSCSEADVNRAMGLTLQKKEIF